MLKHDIIAIWKKNNKNTVFRVRKSLQIISKQLLFTFFICIYFILGYQESFANGAK